LTPASWSKQRDALGRLLGSAWRLRRRSLAGVDSGVLNPALMDDWGPEVGEAWRKSSLKWRIEAIIAHEYEEHFGGSHAYAVEHAPETELAIGDPARKLLETIREGERRR